MINSNEIVNTIKNRTVSLKDEILDSHTSLVSDNRIFYISLNGDDNNTGTSIDAPWRSLQKINNYVFEKGDIVLFERTGLWRGNISAQSGVSYGAYGRGPKPKIYGSPENGASKKRWSLWDSKNNIWKYNKSLLDVGCIIFDEGTKYANKIAPRFLDGKYFLSRDKVVPFSIEKHLQNNLDFFCDCRKEINENGIIQVQSYDNLGDIYLKCDFGNPGEVFQSIEFLTRPNIFSIRNNNDIHIDNLCLKFSGGHAIGGYNCKNISVTNCEIGWIGGSIQFYKNDGNNVRYGNGIEIAGFCDNFSAHHNYIYQVYDTGITFQSGENSETQVINNNVLFNDNLIEFCNWGIEYVIGKCLDENLCNIQKNIFFERNIIRCCGFGFGELRPNDGTSSCIKTWMFENRSENFHIRNNIFERSKNELIFIQAHQEKWLPKMYDNIGIQYLSDDGLYAEYGTILEMYKFSISEIKDVAKMEKCEKVIGTKMILLDV